MTWMLLFQHLRRSKPFIHSNKFNSLKNKIPNFGFKIGDFFIVHFCHAEASEKP
jgi:hypothetical protein